eukprot:TRINITY_DN11390_c0_g1_i3.p2 TRINITY_DN11390_c0_g1~~TRINITY_DN11390_c0_g1_i3.p2  ORF type:complete len:607 (-),score=187.68 TRINITY_DN11390_c0_g1_i3:180-2000(-)
MRSSTLADCLGSVVVLTLGLQCESSCPIRNSRALVEGATSSVRAELRASAEQAADVAARGRSDLLEAIREESKSLGSRASEEAGRAAAEAGRAAAAAVREGLDLRENVLQQELKQLGSVLKELAREHVTALAEVKRAVADLDLKVREVPSEEQVRSIVRGAGEQTRALVERLPEEVRSIVRAAADQTRSQLERLPEEAAAAVRAAPPAARNEELLSNLRELRDSVVGSIGRLDSTARHDEVLSSVKELRAEVAGKLSSDLRDSVADLSASVAKAAERAAEGEDKARPLLDEVLSAVKKLDERTERSEAAVADVQTATSRGFGSLGDAVGKLEAKVEHADGSAKERLAAAQEATCERVSEVLDALRKLEIPAPSAVAELAAGVAKLQADGASARELARTLPDEVAGVLAAVGKLDAKLETTSSSKTEATSSSTTADVLDAIGEVAAALGRLEARPSSAGASADLVVKIEAALREVQGDLGKLDTRSKEERSALLEAVAAVDERLSGALPDLQKQLEDVEEMLPALARRKPDVENVVAELSKTRKDIVQELKSVRQYCEGIQTWLSHLRTSIESGQEQSHNEMLGISTWLEQVHGCLSKTSVVVKAPN